MAESGPEKPKPEKRDLFEPTGELKGGYDMGMARAYALDHAKKTVGESVGKGKERRPLIWNVEESRYDEDAECFEVVLSCQPEKAVVRQKGVWAYHVRSMGGLMPGTPLLRQSLEYTLPPRRRRRRWAWALLVLMVAVVFVVLGGLAEKAAQEKAARSPSGATKPTPVSAPPPKPKTTPLPKPTPVPQAMPPSETVPVALPFDDAFKGGTLRPGWDLYPGMGAAGAGWNLERKEGLDQLVGKGYASARIGDETWTDYMLKTRVMVEEGFAHLWFRDRKAGAYFVRLPQMQLWRVQEGSQAVVERRNPAGQHGIWYDLWVVASGSRIEVYVDGELALAHTDSNALPGGGVRFEPHDGSILRVGGVTVAGGRGLFPTPRPMPVPTRTPVPKPTPFPTPTRSPYAGPYSSLLLISLPAGEGPTKDPRVRKALAQAIDKKALAIHVAELKGTPVFAIAKPGDSILELSAYDLELAKKTLAEAGYENGFDLKVSVPKDDLHLRAVESIVKQWGNIGLNVSWGADPGPLLLPRVAMMYSAPVKWPDTGDLLSRLFSSGSKENYSRYSDPEVDKLLQAALSEGDPDKKAGLLQDAERRALGAYHVIPLLWHHGPTSPVATPTPVPTPTPTPKATPTPLPKPTVAPTPTPPLVLGKWELIKGPTRDNLYEVTLVDNDYGWAVGEAGTIIHTTDGGTSWQVQESGTVNPLMSLSFLHRQKGWALASSGIVITTNDGKTWTTLATLTPQGGNLSRIRFVDASTGWIVGLAGQLYKTVDGGRTWTRILLQTRQWLTDISMYKQGQYGWIVGYGGTALYTTDGGATWAFAPKVGAPDNLTAVSLDCCRDEGFAVTDSGAVYFKDHVGQTWQRVRAPPAQPLALWSVHKVWGPRAWAVGDGATIFHTTNNRTWVEQPSGTGQRLRSVFGRDPDHVVAVGEGGTILRYVPIVPWLLFKDNFNDGEDVGWQNQWGDWRVTQALTYAPTRNTGGDERAIAGDPAWKDYQVDAQLRISSGGVAGLGVRLQNDRDGIWFVLNAANKTTYWLIGKGGSWGPPVNVKPWDTSAVDFSKPIGVGVGAVGGRYGAWLHGATEEFNNLMDSTYSRGMIGVHINMNYEQPSSWDNISVVTLIP